MTPKEFELPDGVDTPEEREYEQRTFDDWRWQKIKENLTRIGEEELGEDSPYKPRPDWS